MQQHIKPEVLQKIKDDDRLILLIAEALGKRWRTVFQWVMDAIKNDTSEQLQVPAVLQIICEHLGYKEPSEILAPLKSVA